MVPFESMGMVSHSIVTRAYGSVLYLFGDKARYWSKIAIFSYPCINAHVRGFPLEYCHNVWYRKSRMVWLSDGEKV